jgi:hypothetical protein
MLCTCFLYSVRARLCFFPQPSRDPCTLAQIADEVGTQALIKRYRFHPAQQPKCAIAGCHGGGQTFGSASYDV